MDIKIIKVTDKGQISLPVSLRQELRINTGDELIVARTSDAIIMRKIKTDDFKDLLQHSESVASKLWDNDEDEIWNSI